MTPEEREERNDAAVRLVRRHRRPHRRDRRRACRRSSASSRTARPRRPGLKVDDVIVAVDGTADRRHDHRRGRRLGPRRGRAPTSTSRPGRRRPAPSGRLESSAPTCRSSRSRGRIVPGTKTALIRLDQFSTGAADDVVQALKDARAAGADRIVLDLRGNPGGYVNEAVGVASQFLTSGVVYIERNAAGRAHGAHGVARTASPPTCRSSSSSTATPPARRRSCRARCRTPGARRSSARRRSGPAPSSASSRSSDGSALRIGTVEWLTPEGRRIWHEGIAPDVPVALPDGVAPLTPDDVRELTPAEVDGRSKDAQLSKALEVVATEAVAELGARRQLLLGRLRLGGAAAGRAGSDARPRRRENDLELAAVLAADARARAGPSRPAPAPAASSGRSAGRSRR